MTYKTYALVIAAFFISRNAFGQLLDTTHTTIYDFSEISNETFLQTEDDAFGEEVQYLADDIERIARRKFSLTTATRNDLLAIPTVTDLDISGIFSSRRFGIPINLDILQRVQNFERITPVDSGQHIFLRTRAVAGPNASQEAAYQNNTYHGSPIKTSSRFIANTDDFLFSMTQAKDPGEPMYFDFVSGCFAVNRPFSITDDLSISKLVVGDYSLSYGSGLLFSNGYSQAPVRDIHAIVEPHSTGINPYISSSSFRFFRGAASEVTSGIFSASGFFSDRKIDATVVLDSITSLYSNGYHRTTSELARKDQAGSSVVGAHISITPIDEGNYLQIGATEYNLGYDKPMKDTLSTGFYGQKHSMISADFRGTYSTVISMTGEFARMVSDAGKENAFAISMIVQPFKLIELSMNYHDLPPNFISPFGGTFGIHSGTAQNETGYYIGSKFNIIPNRFSFFGSGNFSSSTNVANGETRYSDIRFGSIYSFRYLPLCVIAEFRSYGKGHVFTIADDSLSKTSVRFELDARLTKSMNIRFRSEFQNDFSEQNMTIQKGYLYSLKYTYEPIAFFYLSSGISFFKTDSYSSRLYSNEDDLPGAVPFVSLYGTGYRYHVVCSYEPSAEIELSAKIAESRYTPSLGSSIMDKATIGIQVDLAF